MSPASRQYQQYLAANENGCISGRQVRHVHVLSRHKKTRVTSSLRKEESAVADNAIQSGTSKKKLKKEEKDPVGMNSSCPHDDCSVQPHTGTATVWHYFVLLIAKFNEENVYWWSLVRWITKLKSGHLGPSLF